jgi:hypothetical protein
VSAIVNPTGVSLTENVSSGAVLFRAGNRFMQALAAWAAFRHNLCMEAS